MILLLGICCIAIGLLNMQKLGSDSHWIFPVMIAIGFVLFMVGASLTIYDLFVLFTGE